MPVPAAVTQALSSRCNPAERAVLGTAHWASFSGSCTCSRLVVSGGKTPGKRPSLLLAGAEHRQLGEPLAAAKRQGEGAALAGTARGQQSAPPAPRIH